MFGVYFHIPFCKSKCGYCDFYSVASQNQVPPMVQAMLCEMQLRKNYFDKSVIARENSTLNHSQPSNREVANQVRHDTDYNATLYFGGGTPSLLQPEQIALLAQNAIQTFGIKRVEEFTIEANPDDLTNEYLQALRDIGVDRLSIGVQSFFDDDLLRVNRRHTAQQAIRSIELAQKVGFDNISIDLIYGLPGLTLERWTKNLETAFSLNIQHISAYALSVEPRTPFGVMQRKGKLVLPTENEVVEQSALLNELCARQGFTHYEISNFAREGFFARHNTAYWQQRPYIGIGPSAHSYDGAQRQCNVANNTKYVQGINAAHSVIARSSDEATSHKLDEFVFDGDFFETENLTQEQHYNEYIFTGLRTMWGVDLDYVQRVFGEKLYKHCSEAAQKLLESNKLTLVNRSVTIPEELWIVADSILLNLIWA